MDVELLAAVLGRHSVDYVLVGGLAAVLQGAPVSTFDIDVTPAKAPDNLARLCAALWDLRAQVFADPDRSDLFADGRPPEADDFGFVPEALLRRRTWQLMCDAGPLDLVFRPDAFPGGYEDLAPGSVLVAIGETTVAVASLDDVIASKRAAGRPKDRVALPLIEEVRDRARGRLGGRGES